MLGSENPESVKPHHLTVVVHHFGDHAHRLQSGEPAEIDGRFGVAGAFTHSPSNGTQRKNMPGTGQRVRAALRIGDDAGGEGEGSDDEAGEGEQSGEEPEAEGGAD